MKKKFDIEAQIFIYIMGFKEEKNKEYSSNECDQHIVYIFEDYEEFKNYFINNGCKKVFDDFLSLCEIKNTKKGSIIALKGLCDYAITRILQSELEFDEEEMLKIKK